MYVVVTDPARLPLGALGVDCVPLKNGEDVSNEFLDLVPVGLPLSSVKVTTAPRRPELAVAPNELTTRVAVGLPF